LDVSKESVAGKHTLAFVLEKSGLVSPKVPTRYQYSTLVPSIVQNLNIRLTADANNEHMPAETECVQEVKHFKAVEKKLRLGDSVKSKICAATLVNAKLVS